MTKMLPIVLVLFVATGAFAAPSVSVSQVPINEIAPAYDSGRGVTPGLLLNLWDLCDGGDTNVHILTLEQVVNDYSRLPNSYAQAQAVATILAVLGELATGVPGDACNAANAINAYASGRGGNSYLGQLAANIDLIAQLANNPEKLRYAVGQRGNCAGGGRSYQFEAAWDAILNRANPYTIGLVNEEYCTAKRLYQALNVRSNNVGAAATAAALPPVVTAVQRALGPVLAFLRAAANGNVGAAAVAAAKQALLS
ncbi:fibroin light chain-like [Pectinophora gossypiella]|uniref:fibroin light chain-like n=1 Tax=Pectinophora gossypiella TaxID=13191 RepID=UPI00214E23F1|nr:fibroin light chain-like [Pectinophora gossypiella]